MGCDSRRRGMALAGANFNPRTPCGVRLDGMGNKSTGRTFQSTHPVWGATPSHIRASYLEYDFNPRTPCGVRRRTGGARVQATRFQSTHPVWGATCRSRRTDWCGPISIHAPRVGCDWPRPTGTTWPSNFNPRTPCGVRPNDILKWCTDILFQSTHPVWGATKGHRRTNRRS